MEFTEPYKHTNSSLCKFSPNSDYLATTLNNNLIVRDSESLDNVIVFNCEDKIDYFEFDSESNLILCLIKNLRIIQFWSLRNLEWTGKLTNTLFEISEAGWVPNGKFFWSFAEPSLRLTIFSISSEEIGYIQNVKFGKKGMSYREDNLFLAILERKDGKDFVGIYNTENWDMKRNFVLDSIDAQGILWSPNGQFIVVWESYVENKLWIYSPIGELITSYQSHQVGLGIKVVKWSPMSKYLILSNHNQSIELLNTFSWKPSIIFNHFQHFRNTDIDLYEELDNPTWKHLLDPNLIGDGGNLLPPPKEKNKEARYTIAKLPFSVPTIPLDVDKPDPPVGASICSFNSDGTFVVSRNDNMPNNLWIWSLTTQKLIAFSNQLLPIKQAIWNPVDPSQLTFFCGNKHIYLWTLEIGFECFEIPFNEFIIKNIDWSPDGSSIVLSSKDTFCLGFPILEINNNNNDGEGGGEGEGGDNNTQNDQN